MLKGMDELEEARLREATMSHRVFRYVREIFADTEHSIRGGFG
jgi:hypothetical protein